MQDTMNMKSPTPTSNPGITQILKACCLSVLLASFASCSGGSPSSSATFDPNHWHKVSDKPPTYYPKGVPANYPATSDNGTWILTKDSAQTSYYVPRKKHVDSPSLVAEATTRVISSDDSNKVAKSATGAVKGGIYGFFYMMTEVMRAQERSGVIPPNSVRGNAIRDYETSR